MNEATVKLPKADWPRLIENFKDTKPVILNLPIEKLGDVLFVTTDGETHKIRMYQDSISVIYDFNGRWEAGSSDIVEFLPKLE